MADIELVIKIPERDYDLACNYPDALIAAYAHYIKDGTPLHKGHGRLIDADRLWEFMRTYDDYQGAKEAHDVELIHRDSILFAIETAPTVDTVPKSELFELFDRITTAWNGKQRFFPQEDGTIYDRNKCDYVKSLDDAVNLFCEELCKDEYALVVHGEWINPSRNPDIVNKDFFSDCSVCGETFMDESNYCPSCGAKMKKPKLQHGDEDSLQGGLMSAM